MSSQTYYTLVYFGFYTVPALVLFGATLIAVHLRREGVLLPVDFGGWILPGLVYYGVPQLIYQLRWYGIDLEAPSKSLANIIEPPLVALLSWLAFLVRIRAGTKNPYLNKRAAYWAVGVGVVFAIAVLFFVPGLNE